MSVHLLAMSHDVRQGVVGVRCESRWIESATVAGLINIIIVDPVTVIVCHATSIRTVDVSVSIAASLALRVLKRKIKLVLHQVQVESRTASSGFIEGIYHHIELHVSGGHRSL